MAYDWLDAQDELIRDNPDWAPERLAAAVNAIGPCRSVAAIIGRRAKLGLLARDNMTAEECRAHEAARRAGWPVMVGSLEARDGRYVQTLLKAMSEAGVTPWSAFMCVSDRTSRQTPSLARAAQ
jgi:hypothetical protein